MLLDKESNQFICSRIRKLNRIFMFYKTDMYEILFVLKTSLLGDYMKQDYFRFYNLNDNYQE